ncbi:fumarylacetoacetate hydrolase family protein [Agromyces silvae]|uniref:fumarylacetoacetate hydrolase family protein n=1 Tax=Agromyces silvae TaxID=3388266 RepID=UPI00280B9848|nr:fumarylacetoacetate hydrolase family protein [Agromyces protaetiae]
MKYVTFRNRGRLAHGIVEGEELRVLGDGDLSRIVTSAGAHADARPVERLALDEVSLTAPLQRPGKVLAVAANYQEHVREGGFADREKRISTPRLFLKPDTSIAGPDEPIAIPDITEQLDWEAELAVVIGTPARAVDERHALDHVFGYMTSNDLSARSLVVGHERDGEPWTAFFDWLAGKWLDASAPIGPWLVSADEVGDPHDLALTLEVNGETRQSSTTGAMIFSVAEIIAFASRLMTLNPGDVILTGTPAGVGASSGTFLAPGDVMVAEVEGLGRLRTPVIAAPA